MSNQRRIVRRVDLPAAQGFDEEFWPIVVAMSVLLAISVGAIVTLLAGIWMWASLLMLPGLVALCLAALRMIDRKWIRRSIQIALILSLSLHLLLLIIACRTSLFANSFQNELTTAEPKKSKPIRITFRRQQQKWEPQPQPDPTPEKPIEDPEKQQQPSQSLTKTETQVSNASRTNQQSVTQRQNRNPNTVPKFGSAPSKMSRQRVQNLPQSSQKALSSAMASNSPTKSESKSQQPRKTEITRHQNSSPALAKTPTHVASKSQPQSQTQRAQNQPAQPQKSQTARNQSTPRTLTPNIQQPKSATPTETTGAPGASLSRITAKTSQPSSASTVDRKSPETQTEVAKQIPKVQSQTAKPSRTSNARTERDRPKPSAIVQKSSAQVPKNSIAFKPNVTPTNSTQPVNQTNPAQTPSRARVVEIQKQNPANLPQQADLRRPSNPSTNITQQMPIQQQQRRTENQSPSLPRVAANNPQPRRSVTARPNVTSPTSLESPSMSKTAQTQGPSQLAPRPLALSKGSTGTAGGGSSANLKSNDGPRVSPAKIASNSSRRTEQQSRPSPTQSLVAKDRSEINRAVTGAAVPQMMVKTDSQVGSISGSPTPKQISASASASIQSSSTNSSRGKMSAEKGSSSVDMGPTKIVADQNSSRAGGGGKPTISQQSIASSNPNSGTGPTLKPNIAANAPSTNPTSPLAEGTAPPSTNATTPDARSTIAQRQSNAPPTIGQPSDNPADMSPATTPISGTSNNQRSNRTNNRPSQIASSASADEDDDKKMDRVRKMIAQIPSNQPLGSDNRKPLNDPAQVNATNSVMADTETQKQSTGTLSTDLAKAGSLVQANSSNHSRIANSSNSRRERIGSDQVSRMIVGQSQRDRSKLSPVIGGVPLENPSDITLAQSSNGNQSNSTNSRGVEIIKKATHLLPSTNIGPTTTRVLAAGASMLPPMANPRSGSNGKTPSTGKGAESDSNPRADFSPMPVVESTADANQPLPGTGQNPSSHSPTGTERVADAEKQSPAGMLIEMDGPDGPGGLTNKPSQRIGINSVRASNESRTVQLQPTSRFQRPDRNNQPLVSSAAVVSTKPFQSRRPNRRRKQTPQNARAIELGLAFLARNQNADGSWSLEKFDQNRKEHVSQLKSDTAATGLAVLAFQGAGFNHKEFQYSENLNRAIQWLVENQKADGNLYVSSDANSNKSCQLYSHAIAALALTEAYGMTQDPEIKQAAQKSLDFIANTQDQKFGGWRYFPNVPDRRSDTSVTGWMVMALQSGRLAGLKIKSETLDGISDFLLIARDINQEHLFRYNPNANPKSPKQRLHPIPSHSMTSVGLLMRIYIDWDKSDQRLLKGADHLLTKLPSDSTREKRDTYYWYYATQVLNHIGGERWQQWNEKLEPLLTKSQVTAGEMSGSWDPYYPVADQWGAFGGRLYVTVMNLLSLEVEYRKLPIYQESDK